MTFSLFSDHKAALLEVRVDLSNSFTQACISKVEVVFNGEIPMFLGSIAHNFVEAGVDNVDFTGAGEVLHMGGVLRDLVAHQLEDLHILLLLVLFVHTAGGDVIQVFKPLEIRAGNTSSVGEHVGHNDDTSLFKSVLRAESSRSVGALKDDLALEQVAVVLRNSFFLGSRDQDITLLFHIGGRVQGCFLLCSAEANESTSLCEVSLCRVNVDSVGVVDG